MGAKLLPQTAGEKNIHSDVCKVIQRSFKALKQKVWVTEFYLERERFLSSVFTG